MTPKTKARGYSQEERINVINLEEVQPIKELARNFNEEMLAEGGKRWLSSRELDREA